MSPYEIEFMRHIQKYPRTYHSEATAKQLGMRGFIFRVIVRLKPLNG